MITSRVVDEAMSWYNKHNKPVLMSEYGSDTIEGLHLVRTQSNIVFDVPNLSPNLVTCIRVVRRIPEGTIFAPLQGFRYFT